MPKERVLLVASGTQAERTAALTRLAAGTHPTLRLDEGDLVILSSRIIPGNDRPVFDMMAGFLRAGIELVSRLNDAKVHASGHAHRDEQLRMIELTQPRGFVPLHGTLHHLIRHAGLARDAGVGEVLVVENGEIVQVEPASPLRKGGRVTVGKVATFAGEELSDDVIRDRAQIGRAGAAFVSLVLDRNGVTAAPPQVLARGVLADGETGALRRASLALARTLEDLARQGRARTMGDEELAQLARNVARRSIEQDTGHRPVVTVAISRL
jgi:ribonuclease J